MAPFRPPLRRTENKGAQKHDEEGDVSGYGPRAIEMLAGAALDATAGAGTLTEIASSALPGVNAALLLPIMSYQVHMCSHSFSQQSPHAAKANRYDLSLPPHGKISKIQISICRSC